MQWERPDAARKAQWNSENIMCDGRGLRLQGLPALALSLNMDDFVESTLGHLATFPLCSRRPASRRIAGCVRG